MAEFDFSEFLKFEDFLTSLINSQAFKQEFEKAFKTHGRFFVRKLISKRTRGRPGLKRQTGSLARSIKSRVFGRTTDGLVLSVSIGEGLNYAAIQEVGGIVRPRGRFLAIPLDAVTTRAGIPRFRPRDPRIQPTFVLKLGRKLFIAKTFRSRGEASGVLGRGKKIFINKNTALLFVLKKSVKIPPRLGARALFKDESVTQKRQRTMQLALNRALKRSGIA